MSDEFTTIKAQPPQFRRSRWSVLLIGAGSLMGTAIGMSGTNTLRAYFFISLNAVGIAVIALGFAKKPDSAQKPDCQNWSAQKLVTNGGGR
jgi:hypothetical protein